MILLFVGLLVVETALRIRFPWDLFAWSESPFLTNLMKLDAHQPIYTAPADGNSFVYAPGLEYICYAILKPFGLELDIRFDRLVSTLLGIFAAGFGALAVTRLARSVVSVACSKLYFIATWGIIWLVLSKNFMADINHPDNLHALHAALIFWLSLVAVETGRFGVAALAMLVAGAGIFTKQTEMISLLGPLAAFAIYNRWGWARWFLLGLIGAGTLALCAWVLWRDENARFWTRDLLLQHQKMYLTKSYWLLTDLFSMDRGPLVFLGMVALPCLWSAGSEARRYLVCWGCIGFFSALPNVSAYLKTMGIWNDIVILEIWLILIVRPFFGMMLDSLPRLVGGGNGAARTGWDQQLLPYAVCGLMVLFIALLLPIKAPPRASDVAFGQALDAAVRADVQAGRKVLLTHSTEPLIHAGVTEVPLDRANSVLELVAGEAGSMSAMKSRIESHYYDRIYLLMGKWYHADISNCIAQNYQVDSSIPSPPYVHRLVEGYGDLMEEPCLVLSPRGNASAVPAK